MMFDHEFLFDAYEEDVRHLGRNRIEVEVSGMTITARVEAKEIRRGETVHFCELEDIRMSTWHYQLLTEDIRESLGPIITIVEP